MEARMTVDETATKFAITEVLYRYCRSLDRMDEAMYATVFVAGAPLDYGQHFRGTAEGFRTWVWDAHDGMQGHSHQISNVLIAVAPDGASAVSEAYVTVCLRTKPDANGAVSDIVDRGRYLDRWTRQTDGTWRIAARQFVGDIQQLFDMSALPACDIRRDASDPSFELFGQLR
jgi:hypothetical protein